MGRTRGPIATGASGRVDRHAAGPVRYRACERGNRVPETLSAVRHPLRPERPIHRRTSMNLIPKAGLALVADGVRVDRTRAGADRHAQEDQGDRRDHDRPSRVVDPVLVPRRQAAADRLRDGPLHEGRRRGQGRAQDAQSQGQSSAGHLRQPDSPAAGRQHRHGVRLDDQQHRAAEAGGVRPHVLRDQRHRCREEDRPVSSSSPTSTARRSRRPPARRRFRCSSNTKRRRTSTSRRSTARTMPNRSCCSRRIGRPRS